MMTSMIEPVADDFAGWLRTLERRHLEALTFAEVSRALRALSSTFVERRRRIAEGAVLNGAGKRAAFALFYGPLHYLLIREIVRALPNAASGKADLLDLGCGTGAAGAAWGGARTARPRILGIDRHPWALDEAARTYRAFGLNAATRRVHLAELRLPKPPVDIIVAFALNELANLDRERVFTRLIERARRGNRLLIVEPLARFIAPWWDAWRAAVEKRGGRADEWRFRVELPALVNKLDRSAGLVHS
jgi:SAM-dependent methyltransferase